MYFAKHPVSTRFVLAAILFAAWTSAALAANIYWTGATSTNWNLSGNWSGPVPGSSDAVVFDSTFTNQPQLTNNQSIGGIWMTGAVGQDVTITTSSGNELTLAGTTINGTAGLGLLIDNSNSFRLTINVAVKINNAQTWRNSSSNLLTVGGTVNLNGKALAIDGIGDTRITGVMSSGGAFTKGGIGTLTLTAANTYTGTTTVSGGILNIQSNTALGATGSGTSVLSGAELQVQGGISVGNEALTLSGSGVSGSGALRNINGNNSWSGALTLGSAATIGSSAGTLTLSGAINTAGFLLTTMGAGDLSFGGVISGAGGLTKTGSGTLTFSSSANTYTGMTTVKDGLLLINTANKSAGFAGDLTVGDGIGAADSAIVRLTQDQQISANANVFIKSDGWLDTNGVSNKNLSSLDFTGGHLTTGADMFKLNGDLTSNASSSTALIEGELNILGATRTFTIANGGTGTDVKIAGVLSGTVSMIKAGLGTLRLEGNNTITSAITISAGTIVVASNNALGTIAGATSITSGARLAFDGGIAYTTAESVTVNGSGIGGTGAILNLGGTNSFAGTLTIGSASTFGSSAGTLTLSANMANAGFGLTATGPGNLTFSGVVSGVGGWTKTGAGTLTFSNANTFTGVTTLGGGVLSVATIGNGGVAGNLGAATNAAANLIFEGGTLQYTGATASTDRNFTINTGKTAIFDVTTNALTLTGAAIASNGGLTKIGSGTLVLSGANAYTGATSINVGTLRQGAANVISDSSAVTVASGATYDLNGFNETIGSLAGSGTVTSGAAGAITLTAGANNTSTSFSGVIQNGSGTLALTKSGSGTLTLSTANTYSGATMVSAGVLNIQNATALGTTAAGTTVSTGAALQLQGGIAVGVEALTLNGGGIASNGALRNISGNNSWSGNATLGSAATIASDAGTLTLSGTISNGSFGLTIGGVGNVTASNVISGSGGLTKNGSGTLILSGANTYSGATLLSAGVLNIQNAGALGSTAAGTTINSGAALQLQGGIAVGVETMTLNGDGIASDGALRNLSGNNSWSGNVTLGSASTIASDAGTLTLSGTFANGGNVLTVSGAGNLTASNVISGAAGLTKNGAGTLNLSAANTYVGTNTINGGLVVINSNTSLGNSGNSVTLNAATVQVTSTFAATRVFMLGSVASTFQVDASHTFAINTGITGSGTLNKTGAGTLTLASTNSYAGVTNVTAGTLNVTGSIGAVTVASGASLTGTGTTGAVTASAGSTVAPGVSGAGILNTGSFNGNAAFNLTMQIGGTIVGSQYDQLSVTGSVNLAGNLQVSLINGFTPTHGDKFFLIINDGADAVNGTFSGLYQDSIINVDGYDFSISYAGDWAILSASGGNDVVLTVVPEPNTFETVLMGFLLLLLFQRARVHAHRSNRPLAAQ